MSLQHSLSETGSLCKWARGYSQKRGQQTLLLLQKALIVPRIDMPPKTAPLLSEQLLVNLFLLRSEAKRQQSSKKDIDRLHPNANSLSRSTQISDPAKLDLNQTPIQNSWSVVIIERSVKAMYLLLHRKVKDNRVEKANLQELLLALLDVARISAFAPGC